MRRPRARAMRSDKVFSYLNAPFARAFLRLPPCASVFTPAPLRGRFVRPPPCAGIFLRPPLARGTPSPCGRFLCMKFRIQIKTAGRRPCAQSFPRAGRAGYGLCSRRSRFRAPAAPAMVSAPAAVVSARRPRRLWSPLPPRTFPRAGRADYDLRSRRGRFRASAASAMVSAPAADVSARRPRRFLFSSPPPCTDVRVNLPNPNCRKIGNFMFF